MSKAMAVVALMALGLMVGCEEEGDGSGSGGGCERPEGPPTMEADFCQWGPLCATCAIPVEVYAYYEPSEDGCAWVEVWKVDVGDRTSEQIDQVSDCSEAQGGFDNTMDFRSDQ